MGEYIETVHPDRAGLVVAPPARPRRPVGIDATAVIGDAP